MLRSLVTSRRQASCRRRRHDAAAPSLPGRWREGPLAPIGSVPSSDMKLQLKDEVWSQGSRGHWIFHPISVAIGSKLRVGSCSLGSLSCCTTWRLNVSRIGSATHQPRVVHVVIAAQSTADDGRATYATPLAAGGEVCPSLLPARFAMTPLMSVLHPERSSDLRWLSFSGKTLQDRGRSPARGSEPSRHIRPRPTALARVAQG